ncbi:hypothetical protein I4I73_19230 [Pseudonocardia sp. KRD-184]|uniref:Uncharacterized protein n=1 Tax=Pseudonocardia oceani TaxID=2792013 RepID=A0ABS6UC81_9PSEU|nr:hypothetical protein [Pseudonocardia oceani]MBW0091016.1 hypothetical protein [Pseudonocardia oceani]MBW0098119.1 hypothetical protein [Pseudonocardia oceani]MBW0107531.1 hypothetical protein [Pseudonocardia oceani]MBW0120634.1 hypothetical protein [Pseudonocardia oceani]MBW0129849.1 hypothetical protein [Pseudonocardia oceani]
MTLFTTATPYPSGAVRDREDRLSRGHWMLLMNEALARSRQQEAEQAARDHALARQLVAGRTWARLAAFAQRRAESARRRSVR